MDHNLFEEKKKKSLAIHPQYLEEKKIINRSQFEEQEFLILPTAFQNFLTVSLIFSEMCQKVLKILPKIFINFTKNVPKMLSKVYKNYA